MLKKIANKFIAYLVAQAMAFMSMPVYAVNNDSTTVDQQNIQTIEKKAEKQEVFSQIVYPSDSSRLEYKGVVLDIPKNAVDEPVTITIEKLNSIELLPGSMKNSTDGAAGYRFGPHGTLFKKDILVSLPFDPKIAESEAALSNLFSYFYNEVTAQWEKLERVSVDKERFLVTSRTNHFTDMINTTLQLPDLPQGIDFNLNSIKDLKAADPTEAIPKVKGLTPNNNGTASFQIPLRIPQGRGSATPSLAINYNSASQGGWLGRGFDIGFSQITIDTTFGLPSYSNSDSYQLDGQDMILFGEGGGEDTYRLKKETSFDRIIHFYSGNRNYWEVTSKDGSIRLFGQDEAWLGPNKSNKAQVYKWYISRSIDSNGNTVDYSYEYDSTNQYTYLQSINYSGHISGETGVYSINFIADPNGRPDRRIDSRGHFSSKLAERLGRIEIFHQERLVRAYQLNYRINEFGQSQLSSYNEEDGNNEVFYTYNFNYEELEKELNPDGSLAGYNAFGDKEERWSTTGANDFRNLEDKLNLSVGGSLYTGAQIYVPWFWEKEEVANFGIRGGVGFGWDFTNSGFMDINGDGLGDFYKNDNNVLKSYLNSGNMNSGFKTTTPHYMNGLPGLYNQSDSTKLYIGISASLAGLSAGTTKQFSWTDAKSGFLDVDGDGFVDMVKVNSNNWYRNSGNGSFVAVPWNFSGDSQTEPDISEEDLKAFNRTYYQQNPLRRWVVPLPGNIQVNSRANLVDPSQCMDGVSLETYHNNTALNEIVLNQGINSNETEAALHVMEDDKIYLYLDPGIDERGDRVNWETQIKYSDIAYFNDMKLTALYHPPGSSRNALPNDDERLLPIYDESINGDNKEYDLKDDWENHADKIVYEALVSGSYFIPRSIDQELFMQIFEAANKNSTGGTSEQITLAKAYEFQSEWKRFIRKNNQGDQIILRLLPQFTSEEQRKGLAYYRLYDGRQVTLVNQGKTYINDQFFQNPDGVIYSETENFNPGSYIYHRGYLLDRIFDEEGVELSRLWIKNNQNNWEVNEQVITQSLDDIEIIENTNSSAKIRINDIQLEYQFSDLDSYIKDMPSDFYEDIVHHAVIGDRTFKLFDAHQITIELFQTAFERASIDEKTILTDNYILNETDNNYSLNQDIAESNLLIIHNLFDRIYSISESLFNEISPNEKIIISLSENEYNKLSQYYNERDRQNIDSAFLAITRNNVSYYIPAQNHQNISHNLAQYYRDIELFPYYELSGNRRTLIEIPETEDNEEIIAARDEYLTTFWNTLDIGIWKQAEKTLSISYDKILEVEESILPSGKSLLPLAPGVEDIPTGSDAGRVTFTGIDATGKTVIYQRYIPQFDSTTDFNTQNYNSMSPVFKQSASGQATEKMDIPFDDFGGGYRGWYYNIYAGYYKFDTKYIGTFKKQDDKQRDPTPNYTLSAQPNYDNKTDNPLIENTGKKPTVSLNQDTWIGEISSYSKPQLDEYGHNEIIEYTFAPYISANEMAPCRKGGDSFYMAPQGTTPFSGGQLGTLNKSKSDSEDVSGGYSLSGIGGNLSANYGTSWQYAGLNDYNGDRYPDIILHKQDGSREITFIPGSKNGFSSEEKITVPFEKLNINDNATFGFGGSISSGSAGLDIKTDDEGNVISTSIVMGMGIGASANGTFGQGIQTNTLMDINGDSLPDYLSRDEFGDINVLLNTGIRSDWTNTNWSGGMDEKLGDWLYTMLDGTIVTGRSKGLSYSTNGSFGASVSVDFPIAVGVGAGASLGFTANCNKTYFRLVDINSDGLVDQVAKSPDDNYFRVRFNLGDRFSDETIKLFRPDWLNIKEEAIENAAKEDIQRIQGELSGIKLSGAELGSSDAVNFEGENQFEEVVKPLKIEDMLDYSSGAAFNIGANVRFSWELPLLVLEITPGVNGSIASTTTSLQFRDINGDSLPDHVMKRPGEDFVRVKSNHMGKAGLLKQIELPFGGSIDLEYQTEGNTINMPQNRFVLSKVTRNDHLQGPEESIHSYSVEYQYEGGYYDRTERRFIGFEKVTTLQADYSKNEKIYYNRDLYKQGLIHFENNYDSNGFRLSSVTYFYEPYSSRGLNNEESIFQALEQKDSIIYDNLGSEDIETREVFKYSTNGNIEDVFDYGSLHYEDDDNHLHIDYKKNLPGYRLSYPEAMVVYDSKDNILRKRTADYDKQGNPEIIKQYRQGNDYLEYAYKYDQYGNVELATNPASVVTKYIYDEIQNQFVTHIDVYPENNPLQIYSSQMDWDYGLQTNTIRIDQNDNVETRKYDSFGRLTDLFSPYDDVNGIPAVEFEYFKNDNTDFWYSISKNKLRFDSSDSQIMQTLTYSDGLGRIIMTAKQGEKGYGTNRETGWNISGALVFDSKGRTVQKGQPEFISGSELPRLPQLINPIINQFDDQDRITQQSFPDNSIIETDYFFENHNQLIKTTDPYRNITETLKGIRGEIKEIRKLNKAEELLTRTSYSYDGLGQMTEAYDLNKNPVKTTYDLLGNKTSLYTRDTGLTEYFYNNKGQLYRKIDPNLRDSGDAIDYDFDEFGRMYLIDYPWMKDTEYIYGKPGAQDNGAGRLLELSYEAGSTSYKYGLLGEITSMTRTIERQGPSGGSKEATIMYQSDYLGRMEKIIYPDNIDPEDCETVTYGYDSGGQVTSITGEHKDLITKYVEEVGYDEYGQRTYIRLGNKTETHYNYDSERRWLENIKTTNSSGENLQNITYEINKVGNIDYYINDSEDYLTKQTYTYDDLYQLTNVAGQHLSHPNGSVTYRSEMSQHYDFDNLGRMTGKSSQIQNTPRVDQGKGLNYSLDYQYYPDKPHQPERIGNLYYRFDANGNMIEEREGGHSESISQSDFEVTEEDGIYDVPYAFGLYRKEAKENNVYQRTYTWDEENRLKETLEDDLKVEYKYDPSGQRTIKYSEKSENLYFDSLWSLTNDINNFRQSKHIYLGQTRIATKLSLENNESTGYEEVNTYYFHTDHVNSAQYITDYKGKRYEHYEYTPHGEIWIEKQAESFDKIPFRWTGKELDEETGNYYIGARYANPKTSIWLSGDPALENYFPYAFTSEDAKQNSKLPNGGFYNHLNLSPYNFNNNNPIKFMDPDGKCPFFVVTGLIGAAVGAVAGGVKSYMEDGKVDWGQVATGAIIGGVAGATLGAGASLLASGGATALLTTSEVISGLGAMVGIGGGLGAKAIEKAINSLQRIQHASRHLIDSGVLPNWSKNTANLARQLYAQVLTNPTKTFNHVLRGGEAVQGFYSKIDGQNIVVFIYKAGQYAGEVATSIIPSVQQMKNWGL